MEFHRLNSSTNGRLIIIRFIAYLTGGGAEFFISTANCPRFNFTTVIFIPHALMSVVLETLP